MAIINGVGRIGIRSYVAVSQQITTSTLLNSLYSVWNADALGTSLDTSIYGVWNGDGSNNLTVKNAWNANGNIVDSKSGANGTIVAPSGTTFVTGTMSFGTGKLGSGAITFSGTNFVSLTNGTLTFTGDFSASFWIYVPTSFGTNYSRVLSTFDNSAGYTTYKGWDTSYSNGKMSLYIYPGLGTDYYGITVPMTLKDQWVHVTVTKVLGQQGNIYINGVAGVKTVDQRGSGASTQAIAYNVSNLAYMGASYFAFSLPYYTPTVAGGFKIDSIQTWDDVALDQIAVTELYNSGNGQEYPFTLSNALIGTPKDVVGTNHGTLTNGTTFTTGKIGNAFTFDGVNDYVALPDNSLNLDGNMSFSFWIKTSNTTSYGVIIGNVQQARSPYGFTHGYEISINTGYVYTSYRTGININKSLQSTTLVATNSWNHVVVTYNPGTGTNGNATGNKIYINGVLNISGQTLDATGSSTIHYTSPMKACIGVRNYSGTPSDFIPSSNLDSVSIWSKELTQDEIGQLYNAGTGAQYPFSSQTLPSAKNQFAIDNGTSPSGCLPTFTDGKIGKAFTFDGVNDYIALPNNSLNFTGDFSISLWVYLTAFPSEQIPIGNYYESSPSAGNSRGWMIYMSGQNLYWIVCGSSQVNLITSISSFQNTWKQITITFKNGVGSKIYFDGSLVISNSSTITPIYNSTQTPFIGKYQYGNSSSFGYMSSNSKVDGLSVWKKELTQAEVTELYNSGNGKQLTVTTPIVTNGLVLNLDASRSSSYPNTGTTWFDISGNVNNGTLTNGPIFGTANDGSITFDGVDDYVTIPDSTTNRFSNQFSISLSFYWNGVARTNNTFFAKRNSDPYNSFSFGVNNGDPYNGGTGRTLMFFARPDQGGGNILFPNAGTLDSLLLYDLGTTPKNVHAAVTIDSNSQKLYINGTLVSSISTDLTSKTFNITGRQVVLGATRDNASGYFNYANIKIYSAQLYNKSLSATEITQNFNAVKSRLGL